MAYIIKKCRKIYKFWCLLYYYKNEKDINPSYGNKHKANNKAFTNTDTNVTHMVIIISIFDKVKK